MRPRRLRRPPRAAVRRQMCIRDRLGAALADLLMPPEDARVAVVVGPEGGLAPAEVEALLACNPRASLVTLGPTILRTETAGVVAPALVLHELRRMARGRCAL